MYKGIYLALSGAVLKQRQLEIISQNLSNIDTVGYKKDTISFKDYLLSQLSGIEDSFDGRTMSDISTVTTDFSNGNLIETGNPLDIALNGSGFISLEGNQYTRKGNLIRDNDGYLVTQNGIKVFGNSGPIQILDGEIEIDPYGNINVDGNLIDTLKIVDFDNPSSLIKKGEDIFETDQQGFQSKAMVQQGYLETSNVNAISEMVYMINTLRDFETYQKAIQAFDEATAKVTNEMGRM
jgi:flagellar basal-body rod protein FlgG